MKVLEIVEREDGGVDLKVDLTPEELQILIEFALIEAIKNLIDKQGD